MKEQKKPNIPKKKHSHNKTLTKPQEVFIQELIKGTTQRQAYLKAYPSKKKWKETSLDCEASKLFSNTKVKQRYEELLQKLRETEQEKTMWTREQAIRTLRYVVDKNTEEIDRIHNAAEEELELIARALEDAQKTGDIDRATQLVSTIIKAKKARRLSAIHNKGIIDAVAELNKMQGFNEETINLNGSVIFTGEEDLED